MTNMFIEISNGYVMDVTKSTPKPIFYGTKTILKGGDSIQVDMMDTGVRIRRMKGTEVKVDKSIKQDGVYIIMPFFIKKVKRMTLGHRRVYGMLRNILDEGFYLEEDSNMKEPFIIDLSIEMDVVVMNKYIVKINSDLLRSNSNDIKRLIERSINEIDIKGLYSAVGKNMKIRISDEVVDNINSLVNIKQDRMVV